MVIFVTIFLPEEGDVDAVKFQEEKLFVCPLALKVVVGEVNFNFAFESARFGDASDVNEVIFLNHTLLMTAPRRQSLSSMCS